MSCVHSLDLDQRLLKHSWEKSAARMMEQDTQWRDVYSKQMHYEPWLIKKAIKDISRDNIIDGSLIKQKWTIKIISQHVQEGSPFINNFNLPNLGGTNSFWYMYLLSITERPSHCIGNQVIIRQFKGTICSNSQTRVVYSKLSNMVQLYDIILHHMSSQLTQQSLIK